MGKMPDKGPCTFDIGGPQGYFGTANITQDRIAHSVQHNIPVDCVWSIQVQVGYQVFIKFQEPELHFPNDCHLNYLQVRSELANSLKDSIQYRPPKL